MHFMLILLPIHFLYIYFLKYWHRASITMNMVSLRYSSFKVLVYAKNNPSQRRVKAARLCPVHLRTLRLSQAIMLIALVGLFVPRAVVEVGFMYNIYEAYAIYKYYYLIIVFAGGTIPFVEKSRNVDVRPNAVPCPCFVCLPPIRNSA